ncbi:diguanylate cyclase domain-containing protein [Sphingomonas flavalba]|uniref:GGDEF domain-containing protein n=1 Tax=Sphingomonas flavalba TaxID=2559804 RepID=UPI0039DFBB33
MTTNRPGDRRTNRLIHAVRSMLGGDDADADAPDQSGRDLFERIGVFLFTNQLEPLPSHYELAHAYCLGSNRRLRFAVDRAIARDGRLTDEVAEAILAETRSELSAEALSKLIDEAQLGLASIAGVVKQSGADAQAYGEALEDKVAGLSREDGAEGGDQSLAALVFLTRAMIEKTRDAERQLRQTDKRISALRSSLVEAQRVAESDPLTGLANRRAFESQLARAVHAARGNGAPLALAFCDIDNFKKINDTHGHEVGDRVLKYVARLLSDISNDACHVSRHGGEEFVILFEGKTADQAFEVVDDARRTLAARRLGLKDSGDPIGQVTFSAGVAELHNDENGRTMLRNADTALYRAKRHGRNQVLMAEGSGSGG